MANHKSAIKRNRQNLKIRERNRSAKSSVRTIIKKTLAAVESGDIKSARELLKKAEKAIASATTKRLYHPKNGSRKISRLTKKVNRAASN